MRKIVFVFIICAFAILNSVVYADTVVLQDGGVLQGKVVQQSPSEVVVRTDGGLIRVAKSNIKRIVYQQEQQATNPADTANRPLTNGRDSDASVISDTSSVPSPTADAAVTSPVFLHSVSLHRLDGRMRTATEVMLAVDRSRRSSYGNFFASSALNPRLSGYRGEFSIIPARGVLTIAVAYRSAQVDQTFQRLSLSNLSILDEGANSVGLGHWQGMLIQREVAVSYGDDVASGFGYRLDVMRTGERTDMTGDLLLRRANGTDSLIYPQRGRLFTEQRLSRALLSYRGDIARGLSVRLFGGFSEGLVRTILQFQQTRLEDFGAFGVLPRGFATGELELVGRLSGWYGSMGAAYELADVCDLSMQISHERLALRHTSSRGEAWSFYRQTVSDTTTTVMPEGLGLPTWEGERKLDLYKTELAVGIVRRFE